MDNPVCSRNADTRQEFSIEIPDKEADSIHSVNQAVEYILAQPDGNNCPVSFYRSKD